MDNFQYSVQLSDQAWAEFSAAADECGLLQASLASGDELFSSDIDQGDSRGGSPPGPPPLLTGQLAPEGRGWQVCKDKDSVATRQQVSRSQREPGLALGTSQQAVSTSALSEALVSLSLDAAPSGQHPPLPGPAAFGETMQRLLQGPTPRPPGESPRTPESSGHTATSHRPPDSPGTPPRSPGRRKRRAVGAKGGGCSGVPGPVTAPLDAPLLMEAGPQEGQNLAVPRGKGLVARTAELLAEPPQDEPQPESTGAPEQVARQGSGWDPATSVPITGQSVDQSMTTLKAEQLETHPDSSTREPYVALSTPTSESQPIMGLSTPVSKPQPDVAPSTPPCIPRLRGHLPSASSVVRTEMESLAPVSLAVPSMVRPHSVSKTGSHVGVSTAVPGAAPSGALASQAGADAVETETVPLARHQEKPGCPPGQCPPGPVQASRKKKVRFSIAASSSEEPRSREATGPPSPAPSQPLAQGVTKRGHARPAAWDAVAAGPQAPQPRILKCVPPPARSASAGPGPGSCFAVTLPEAYEFFFCDTIEEEGEEEGAKEETGASPALGDIQWPDTCELFFQDYHSHRAELRGGCLPSPPPATNPMPSLPPGDPLPFSFPEAYEHFLGEDSAEGELPPSALLQLQTTEPPWEARTRAPPEAGPATTEQLSLAAQQAGEIRGPLTSLTLSQNDMCLVFVALATWAVRTSDLQTPDAWKTVLLANIGTISAIRYFRRQVRRGRSPSPSRSPASSS
ncbi:PGC-1 and ERR-induced regulator in muscle protein 1 [Ctenodactylus gundi]